MARMNLVGKRYGRLTVIRWSHQGKNKNNYWYTECDCGGSLTTNTATLNAGKANSCGCIGREKIVKRNIKHGMHGTRIYRIYRGIISRCYYSSSTSYENYGGRGIKVCHEWERSFISFYEWAVSSGYTDDLTIERIDNDGNYCPENCCWIPKADQIKNKRPRKSMPERDKFGRFIKDPICDQKGGE